MWLQVWDFDVAVKAQKEPVPCNTDIFSLAHMAPETITEKHLTKVQLLPGTPPHFDVARRACCSNTTVRFPISHQLWIAATLLLHVTMPDAILKCI